MNDRLVAGLNRAFSQVDRRFTTSLPAKSSRAFGFVPANGWTQKLKEARKLARRKWSRSWVIFIALTKTMRNGGGKRPGKTPRHGDPGEGVFGPKLSARRFRYQADAIAAVQAGVVWNYTRNPGAAALEQYTRGEPVWVAL